MVYSEYAPVEEITTAALAIVSFILITSMVIVHSMRLYSDFFTAERTVLDYRRSKPKLTPGYKRMAYLTYSCICFVFLQLFLQFIEFNFTMGNCKQMWTLQIFLYIGFFGAKCTLYLTLILRLHEIYGESAYGYNKNKLKCIAVTIIVMCIIFYCLMQSLTVIAPVYFDDTDTSWPYFCSILFDEKYNIIFGVPLGLFDFTCLIAAMIAFVIPLNKVVKACDKYESTTTKKNDGQLKRLHKMMYTGYKYKVLVITAAITSLTWLMLMIFEFKAIGSILAQIDMFVNPLCLLLMTPYYPSDKYYERICILCILCCDPKRESYRSTASRKHEEVPQSSGADVDSTVNKSSHVGVSVDTDVALHTKLPTDNKYSGNVESNLATVQENNKEITPAPPDNDNNDNDPDDANL